MDGLAQKEEVVSVTALAVEMGFITQQEAALAEARRDALKRGGIRLTLGQTLLERHFVQPIQIRALMKEFEKRTASLGLKRNPLATVPPRMFGQYELLEMLSEKTNSRIIRARDTLMDRPVVLKILPSTLKNDPQWAERFRRETVLLGKMAHPNLVQAFAASEIEGHPVIAMEWVEGSTVGDRIEKEGFLPEKESWLIAREIAKALGYAARAGVIHRDIKPDNIVCSKGGKVKLIDMGLSKSLTDTTHLTVEGTTVGTPFYISPEQARGTRSLDPRTDIYSLGCTVYNMLTGMPPFWGDEITEVMLKHIESRRPDPRDVLPQISAGSAELVMRMMAVQLERRPENADAVVDEITALMPSLPKLIGSDAALPPMPTSRLRPSEVLRIQARANVPPNRDAADKNARRMPETEVQNGNGKQPASNRRSARDGFWNRVMSWFGR